MIDVSFEHWRFTFPDTLLARCGSPHYSQKEAGKEYAKAIYSGAVRAASIAVQFHEAQILCGNEAFPEAAVADPVADLEVWDEWGSGKRRFPYPGRYSKLGITRRDDNRRKTSSPSSVGVVGEILTGFFAQAGVSPWVLVRVVQRWPDFIFSHRDETYSFVESKAFTREPSGATGLRARVLDSLLIEGALQAAQQLNSDPFGRVWCSFTRIRKREGSHIVPWLARPSLRVNPRNGLCLCALHDRAFDRGLMTIEPALTVRLSPRLEQHLPDEVIENMFVAYQGSPIRPPEKFCPEEEFLAYHREVVVVSA